MKFIFKRIVLQFNNIVRYTFIKKNHVRHKWYAVCSGRTYIILPPGRIAFVRLTRGNLTERVFFYKKIKRTLRHCPDLVFEFECGNAGENPKIGDSIAFVCSFMPEPNQTITVDLLRETTAGRSEGQRRFSVIVGRSPIDCTIVTINVLARRRIPQRVP